MIDWRILRNWSVSHLVVSCTSEIMIYVINQTKSVKKKICRNQINVKVSVHASQKHSMRVIHTLPHTFWHSPMFKLENYQCAISKIVSSSLLQLKGYNSLIILVTIARTQTIEALLD